jgi:hypothetical protein
MRHGTDEQRRQAMEVLDGARRKLEGIGA